MDRRGAADALALVVACLVLVGFGPAQARAEFGFSSLDSSFTASGEAPAVLDAGSHPEAWTASVRFNVTGMPGEQRPDGALRDLRIDLPPGLVGSPAALPRCGRVEFIVDSCPAGTAIGSFSLEAAQSLPIGARLHLLEPLPGTVAQLGFHAQGVPVTLDLFISAKPPHNLVAQATNLSQAGEIFSAALTLEGSPGGTPFLTLPRRCPAPLTIRFAAVAWGVPAWVSGSSAKPQGVAGCGALAYEPELSVAPTTVHAAAPSGLELALESPDTGIGSTGGRAAADTRSATLRLPPGMTVNPPAARGLSGCTPAELASERLDSDPLTGCPEAAKIGSAALATPLLEKQIAGDVYVAQPEENPFGSRLALYLVLRDAERGVLLSLPIRVDADPQTGRLTARFDQIPELPFSHLSLRFNSGPRAPLATPAGCGTHAIGYSLSPSSGAPPLEGEETFETGSGCDRPFAPELSVGTASNAAGSTSPFVLELRNAAAAPNLDGLRLTLPPGLGADLAAATCPEALAPAAACPAASRLGFARIALGAGPEPLWVPAGPEPDSGVFLAGPYRGAPFSLLISVPAAAGPFDLGRVVLRAPVRIDPKTAQISVALGELPQIREGIPLHYRAIRLVLDRPGFVRNPTSCQSMPIELTATSAGGAATTLSDRFQAADCAALRFRPRMSVRLSGSLRRNGHPRVEISLAPRAGQANLEAATLDLPAGELLDTRRIRALCARGVPASGCPAASRLGRASLRSPLLREPLSGAVHLRSPSGRYPDLVAELEGGGIRVVLQGRTASAPGGRLRIRLVGLPDMPLSQASISLAGGSRGIVVNSASLCSSPRRTSVLLRGHHGRETRLRPRLRLGGSCKKHVSLENLTCLPGQGVLLSQRSTGIEQGTMSYRDARKTRGCA